MKTKHVIGKVRCASLAYAIIALIISLFSETALSYSAQAQTQSYTVGVLDLDPNNVDAGEARAISERLRYYLGNQAVFRVIERNKMDEIMQEMGFQISGACNTNECIVQVGKILGAQKMVAGSISRVGTLYSLQVRFVDIQTSQIEHQAFSDVNGIEQVLQTGTEAVCRELANKVTGQISQQSTTLTSGSMRLTTGQIRIVSNPPGAEISIDDQSHGLAPATLELGEGHHQILVSLDGYLTREETLEVTGGESRTVNLTLRPIPTGTVRIVSDPPGGTVLVDGTNHGNTPLSGLRLQTGQHRIEVKLDGYDTYTEAISIVANMNFNVTATLLRSGSATIDISCSHRGAPIWVNGQRQTSKTPKEDITVRPGRYEVLIKAPGYATWKQSIELDPGDARTLQAELRSKSRFGAATLSLLLPGAGHFYSRRPFTGTLVLAGVGFLGYRAYSEYDQYQVLDQDYRDLQDDYNNASSTDEIERLRDLLTGKHDELLSSHKRLQTLGIATAAIWGLSMLDAFIRMPSLPRVLPAISPPSVSLRNHPHGVLLNLAVTIGKRAP